jgi:hypothetical protein
MSHGPLTHGLLFHKPSDLCGSWTVGRVCHAEEQPEGAPGSESAVPKQFRIRPGVSEEGQLIFELVPLKGNQHVETGHPLPLREIEGDDVFSFEAQLPSGVFVTLGSADGGVTLVHTVSDQPGARSRHTESGSSTRP